MKKIINIACIQTTLVWEDAEANRNHFADKIDAIDQKVDIVVLPEMFSTGFSMKPAALSESIAGPTIKWMVDRAKEKNIVLAGSMIIEESGKYFNRFLWVEPTGKLQFYDKRHLFSLAGENEMYSAGHEMVIVDFQGWKINLNICYDLRFPVWSRNASNYHVAFYVANWPKPRVHAWSTLLRARAIENQCYVVGVNRIGADKNNNQYNGQSAVLDMEGNYLSEAGDEDTVIYSVFDKDKLNAFRDKFPFYKDADNFQLVE